MYVPPPLPRCSGRASSSLISPCRISLPRKRRRVGLHIVLFEACSAFTRVAARTLAPSPICDLLHRRLQPFRHLHDCSGCFRLERSPGGTCTHWKAPPSHGAHVKRTSPTVTMDVLVGRVRPFECASSTPAGRGREAGTLQRRSLLRQPRLDQGFTETRWRVDKTRGARAKPRHGEFGI